MVEECLSGYIPSLAVGFTACDVAMDGFQLPRRAADLEDTYVAGYGGINYLFLI